MVYINNLGIETISPSIVSDVRGLTDFYVTVHVFVSGLTDKPFGGH